MRWLPYTLVAVPAAMIVPAAQATVYMTVEQAQQSMFAGAVFTHQPVVLSEQIQKTMRERSGVNKRFKPDQIWRGAHGEYVIVDEVLGKHEMIKYAVGIDAAGKIKQIEILQYNESYGYEIRTAEWRAQFVGKSAQASLKLNDDIKNISGATLSCKHVTDGVKRVMVMYELALRPHAA